MNPTPNNPNDPTPTDAIDAQLDDLLAEEAARAHQTPAELEAKVLALTDPRLLSLLDEALAPELPADVSPDALADKIIAATLHGGAHASAEPESETQHEQPAVIGRIAPSAWRYAVAAAVVLAAGVGLWFAGQPDKPGGSGLVDNKGSNEEAAFPEFTADQALFADATEPIEAKLAQVSERINGYTIDRETIWSDMDDFEQFLSDLDPADEGSPAT